MKKTPTIIHRAAQPRTYLVVGIYFNPATSNAVTHRFDGSAKAHIQAEPAGHLLVRSTEGDTLAAYAPGAWLFYQYVEIAE